jgi:endonuclease/exonuclease/phosphatase family metal-dependent hydrolase
MLGVLLLVCALVAALLATNSWRLAGGDEAAGRDDSAVLSSDTNVPLPTFRTATFNLLGYGHTKPGGDAPRYEDGVTRMGYTVKILDRRGIQVVGFQEFQNEQFDRFKQLVGDTWQAYPGATMTSAAMQNSIAWRTDKWELMSARTIPIIYAYAAWIKMPFVLLRDRETGRLVWFANFHNSYDKGTDQQRYRDQARALEIGLANDLWESGVPLVLTGDMNEKETYFCDMASQAPMKSAAGGSVSGGTCVPPADRRIDQIFGSTFLQFTNYTVAETKLIRKASDHPLVYADVSVPVRRRPAS